MSVSLPCLSPLTFGDMEEEQNFSNDPFTEEELRELSRDLSFLFPDTMKPSDEDHITM